MSFCADLKKELADIRPSECCKLPLIYGFMMFGRFFSYKKISLQTNSSEVARFYAECAESVYNAEALITCGGSVRKTYKAEIPSYSDRLKILASVDYGIGESLINKNIFLRDCCEQCFIRGVFLACGNINNPEKEYRAEFSVKERRLADELSELLKKHGIIMKITARNKGFVLYTKESGMIEDILTLIGAPHRTLDIMDTKIMKSVKNNINRVSNCDSANISKTVEASIKQRKAIEGLESSGLLYSLPQELINAANLRKNNPQATLKELCALSEEPLTPSGLNHRFSKITALYEKHNS